MSSTCGHIGTQLQVLGHRLELVHREVGEEHDEVILHPHDQPSVALVSPPDHPHVITLSNGGDNDHDLGPRADHLSEVLLQLVALELQRVLEVVMLRHDHDLRPVDPPILLPINICRLSTICRMSIFCSLSIL